MEGNKKDAKRAKHFKTASTLLSSKRKTERLQRFQPCAPLLQAAELARTVEDHTQA